MKYYKIKISLENYEDRLNRTILFRENGTLDDLAFTIISIFNTYAYHLFKFEDDENKYECEISVFEAEIMNYPDVGKNTFFITLDMIIAKDNKFVMTYDFGADYRFVIEIIDLNQYKDRFFIPRVIDGVGYGIIEDDKDSLIDYLEGKLSNQKLVGFQKNRFETIDFESFDIEACNKKLVKEFGKIRNAYDPYQ